MHTTFSGLQDQKRHHEWFVECVIQARRSSNLIIITQARRSNLKRRRGLCLCHPANRCASARRTFDFRTESRNNLPELRTMAEAGDTVRIGELVSLPSEQAIVEALIECCAERIPMIQDQVEIKSDYSGMEVPVGVGRQWLLCVLGPRALLSKIPNNLLI